MSDAVVDPEPSDTGLGTRRMDWRGIAALITAVTGLVGVLVPVVLNSCRKGTDSSDVVTTNSIRQQANIEAFGGWPRTQGDVRIETSKGPVKVKCATELIWTSNYVDIAIDFYCRELAGDKSTFAGTQKFTVYNAPQGTTILDVPVKKLKQTFEKDTQGANRVLNPFDTSSTYWERLRFRVDSVQEDDSPLIGVDGIINVPMVLRQSKAR